MMKQKITAAALLAACLCTMMSGCAVDIDPPEINALPPYTAKEEMDSGDVRDNLVYGEYHYATYTPEEMTTHLETSGMFAPATAESIQRFVGAVNHFEGLLRDPGANEEFADRYYTDELQINGRVSGIDFDESDWFAYSAYGYFWYDAQTKTVFQYHV